MCASQLYGRMSVEYTHKHIHIPMYIVEHFVFAQLFEETFILGIIKLKLRFLVHNTLLWEETKNYMAILMQMAE